MKWSWPWRQLQRKVTALALGGGGGTPGLTVCASHPPSQGLSWLSCGEANSGVWGAALSVGRQPCVCVEGPPSEWG